MGIWRRLALVVLVLSVVCVGGVGQSWGQNDGRIGTVLAVDGTAEVRAAAGGMWESLTFRASLLPNDTVRTAANSKVKVLLRDDSIVTLAERSEMQFTEFLLTPQQKRTILSMTIGTLRMVTGKIFGTGSTTEVRTPNTVAGVRGTTFVVTFIPPEETEVVALDGTVEVQNLRLPQFTQPVQANFQTRVLGSAAPQLAIELPIVDRQRIEGLTRITAQIPAEVKPIGERQALGPARGELTVSGPAAPLAPPVAVQTASTQLAVRDSQQQLDTLTTRTAQLPAVQSSGLVSGSSAQVITPDNITSATTIKQIEGAKLAITITIPR
jgi:hypothetical protein